MAWGDSGQLKVGEWVLAIGSPFSLSQTVTAGIVSATGRANVGFADYEDFIQTDAAINPGNSGGALINTRGELVGINTGIFSESGGYQGIGFAVPSNLVRRVVDDLMKYGEVRRGSVGYLRVEKLTDQLAEELGAPNTNGAVVSRMVRNSEAYDAGLRPGTSSSGSTGRGWTTRRSSSGSWPTPRSARPSPFASCATAARWTSSCPSCRAGDAFGCWGALGPHPSTSLCDRLAALPPGFEFLEGAAEPHRRGQAILHDVRRLVAVAGHADDDRFVRGMTPRRMRSTAAASVVPPAGSVKMPSVSASS